MIDSNIEGIWQYGTDENDGRNFMLNNHDAIAPQEPISGIGTRRAYIPTNDPNVKLGWYDEHAIGNYGWVFDKIKGENGFILPRR